MGEVKQCPAYVVLAVQRLNEAERSTLHMYMYMYMHMHNTVLQSYAETGGWLCDEKVEILLLDPISLLF